MTHRDLIVVVVAVALTACGAVAPTGGPARQSPIPEAVAALIHDLENQPVRNPPAYVARYDYAGQVVYYVPPHCCDFFGDVYTAAGQVVCHPDGGIAGRGDGRCPDFYSERRNETIIWRDSRK